MGYGKLGMGNWELGMGNWELETYKQILEIINSRITASLTIPTPGSRLPTPLLLLERDFDRSQVLFYSVLTLSRGV